FFIAYAGIEIKRIRIAKSDTVAEGNSPQSIKLQHVATLIVQSADKCACSRVVSINVAITKIAHQQIVTEDSESARSQSHSPRCIQHAVGNQTLQEVAVEIEGADETQSHAGLFFAGRWVNLGIHDKELGAESLNIKRSKSCRQSWISEASRQRGQRERSVI